MLDRPLVDALYEAILNRDDRLLQYIEDNYAEDCVHLRMVACTDDPGAINLDLDLGLRSCDYVTPIFEGPRVRFLSWQTALQTRLSGGCSEVRLDYSLSFDSNFAQNLRALVYGRNMSAVERERVVLVLRLKAKNSRVQFDILPFLNENIRFARDDQANQRPLETLIAFRMLDHLDWPAFLTDSSRLDFGENIESLAKRLRPGEEAFLSSQYTDARVLRQEVKALGTQALLLRLATLRRNHKQDLSSILRGLLDFSIFELGSIPITELALIWNGLSTKQPNAFFGPLMSPSADIVKDARGMAWDLTHLRSLQDMARQTQLCSFFLPYFVSFDARWRRLLRLNPIRLLLLDDKMGNQAVGRTLDQDFLPQLEQALSDQARQAMEPAKIAARREVAQKLDRSYAEVLVAREIRNWG